MQKNKRPLRKSIFIGCSVFIVLLCFILSILTYRTYTASLYSAYQERMKDIIAYVESHIDNDDLAECVATGVESDRYYELRDFMDGIMEDFDIHYLYILMPVTDENGQPVMMNILSADTAIGRETEPDGLELNTLMPDDYEQKDILLYKKAMAVGHDITYFKNVSIWGYDYTGLKNLYDKDGNCYGALCVDVNVYEMEREIRVHTITNVILIIVLGLLFISLFLIWMNRNITIPISKLEKSVVSFAERSHNQKDPGQLNYEDPHIHTHNEVEALSDAIAQMSTDMRDYVRSILDAEETVKDMASKVSHMDMVAYQDSLTHVKNKAWYDKIKERVDSDIASGKAVFAILMSDLNNLKKVNDTYGHEHGNEYITGACHEICVVFQHSPVFRIGGDEFVVLLENSDFEHREELLAELKAKFSETYNDMSKEPWERYSAAMGMAVYRPGEDISMDDVFKRADSLMYKDKLESKMGR
ncbi:GGDEF domain-containing protein [Butyrivibrio sp. XPD2006]|uniref:GGDEF domain-containing protein n=1 Tax=Butyrivibrio sp. XPD2006 TaxID=1280668 RepID=UPI0003B4379D|nr:diguanylate cyclase [Butyrivibrio sp. XPD2006]